MSAPIDRDAHRQLVDDLLGRDDLHAFDEHVAACSICREGANQRAVSTDDSVDELVRQVAKPPSEAGTPPPSGSVTPRVSHARNSSPSELPVVPGYEVLEQIGRGGMGVVYKARHLELNRVVALKMIGSGGAATDEEKSRFRREAEAVARLQHSNIVQIHDVGQCERGVYISLEFVPQGTLGDRLRRLAGKPMPERSAADIVHSLALALDYAHRNGIIHRDVKPHNVLLTEDGILKLTDFGLARLLDQSRSLSEPGRVFGTPSYMAPEQAQGTVKNQIVGPPADVWALGVMLYEMLTGAVPFAGEDTVAVLYQVVHVTPKRPREVRPTIDRRLEAICLKCLNKDPNERYASARALAQDLRNYLDGRHAWAMWLTAASLATAAAVTLFLIFGINWRAQREYGDMQAQLGEFATTVATLENRHDAMLARHRSDVQLRDTTIAVRSAERDGVLRELEDAKSRGPVLAAQVNEERTGRLAAEAQVQEVINGKWQSGTGNLLDLKPGQTVPRE